MLLKTSSVDCGYVFAMTMSYARGNLVDSKRAVWVSGEDGNGNFSVSLCNTYKVMEMDESSRY